MRSSSPWKDRRCRPIQNPQPCSTISTCQDDVRRPQNVARMTSSIPYVSTFLWIWYRNDPKANSPRIVANISVARSHDGAGATRLDSRIRPATTAHALMNHHPGHITTDGCASGAVPFSAVEWLAFTFRGGPCQTPQDARPLLRKGLTSDGRLARRQALRCIFQFRNAAPAMPRTSGTRGTPAFSKRPVARMQEPTNHLHFFISTT